MDAVCYPVVSVTTPASILESKGSREKFWVVIETDDIPWLLKFPRPGTGEHWAEKVAAEVGSLIGVNCARVELARCAEVQLVLGQTHEQQQGQWDRYRGRLGTVCRSFVVPAIESLPGSELQCDFFHGCDVLDAMTEGYNPYVRFGQRQHNVKNVVVALTDLAAVGSLNPMPHWDVMLEQLTSYALLDGLIGNTDRHHENWMLARVYGPGYDQWEEAPSYDHASSLGRELSDERRRQILASSGMLRYLQRGRGGVFVNDRRQRALPPIRLAQLLCRWAPRFTRRTLERIGDVSDSDIRNVIEGVPSEFMSGMAKDFAYELVATSKSELLRRAR